MNDTDENPTPANNSPPANAFVALFQALTGAVSWFMNLPEATAKRLASGASKTWNWVKHLPTMEAQADAETIDALGRLIEKAADADVKRMDAAGRLAESNAKALETEEKALAEVRHRDAETKLLLVKIERERQDMEMRGQILNEHIASGKGGAHYHDDNFDMHLGGPSAKRPPKRAENGAIGSTPAPPELPKPSESPTHGTNGHTPDVNKTLQPEA